MVDQIVLTSAEHKRLTTVLIPALQGELNATCNNRPDHSARSNGSSGKGHSLCGEDCRQENLRASRLAHYKDIAQRARVVHPPERPETVCVGSRITLKYELLGRKGKPKKVSEQFDIVGYEQSDAHAKPPKVSYLAPVAKLFLNEAVGARVTDVRRNPISRLDELVTLELVKITATPWP